MKKKFLIAAFAVGSTLCISQNSYAYTVLGRAILVPISEHRFNLMCAAGEGVCYTNDGVTMDIYKPDGTHMYVYLPSAPPILDPVPGQNDVYRQLNTIEVEELP